MSQHINKSALSVIIVNRNTSGLLIDCLSSLFNSDLKQSPEVLVVDNGSDDDSVVKLKNYFPGVNVLEARRNLGFAAANNLGVSKTHGEFLLLVNTDVILEKDSVSKMLELAESNARIAIVAPQLLNRDGTNQTSYEATPTLLTECTNRSLLKRIFPKRYPSKNRILLEPADVETVIGAVMLIRRKAFEEVGEFDENYFFFFEETDLAVRLRSAGWSIKHEPRAKATHFQGGSAKSVPVGARIEFYRSRYIFFDKFYGKASKNFLKSVVIFNLTLNAIAYGLLNLVTLKRIKDLSTKSSVWTTLLKWHAQGCPDNCGIPRD
ncbi:MAG: glycosyltransferase family 2 protein [Pseudomonadota bacterium]